MISNRMLNGAFAALALLGTEAMAKVSRSDINNYPSFANAMEEFGNGIDWKSYQTTSKDGYNLTLFRLTDNKKVKKGPLLLLHGFTGDAYAFAKRLDDSYLTIGAQLSADGYDVWYGNIRGTIYNRGHEDLDADLHDDEFWDFENETIAKKDIPAMIKLITQESRTCKKVTIVSHSGGSTQTAISLSLAEHAQDYIGQAVLTEPCFVPDATEILGDNLTLATFAAAASGFQLLDIESLFGAQWPTDLFLLRLTLGVRNEVYQTLRNIDFKTEADPVGRGEVGWKQIAHFTQNYFMNRFQAYAPNFFLGLVLAQEYDLGDISDEIPVKMLIRNQDALCAEANQSKYINQVRNLTDVVRLDGVHGDTPGANDPEFKAILDSLLSHDGADMAEDVCYGSFQW